MALNESLSLTAIALLAEAAFGYPEWLFRRLGHPVTWMGSWLAFLERRVNRTDFGYAQRKAAGVLALVLLLAASGGVPALLGFIHPHWAGFAVALVLSVSLPAQRSLDRHVAAVADALDIDLASGQRAVAHIVGRNTAVLDTAGVGRAAVESLAENFADGVVAPAFWMAVGGLTGGVLYKAINTADSMIGHRSERYAAFGWASARLDDIVNLPASRLAALWIVLASLLTHGDTRGAIRAIRRDAGRHRSPNAGWPEAAMAGALGLALAGPRVYGTVRIEDGFMGDGRRDVGAADIRRALRLYRVACALQIAAVLALAIWLA